MSAVRTWLTGLPVSVTITTAEDGSDIVTVEVDLTELSIAARDTALDHGFPPPDEDDHAILERFIAEAYRDDGAGMTMTLALPG